MARTDQGHRLDSLILQPGSEFREGRGGFDSGTRVFTCSTRFAGALAPRRGESDDQILRRALAKSGGAPRRVFPAMYADDVAEREMENDLVQFTVSMLGLKDPRADKPADVVEDTDSENFSAVPSGGYVQISTFQRPVFSVTRTYITRGKKPDARLAGSALTPPGYPERYTLPRYYTVFLDDTVTLFEGWILKRRSNREVGTSRSRIFETVDLFAYEFITNKTS